MTGAVAVLTALRGRAMPAFVDAGSGALETPIAGTLQVAFPSSITAGQFLILHAIASNALGAASITTPSGWTLIDSRDDGGVDNVSACFYRVADGSESGNLNVTMTGTNFAAGRIYRFTRGTGVEAASGAMTTSSAANLDARDVTTLGPRRRVVQLLYSLAASRTVGDLTGETGTDYTEATAEFSNATVLMSCQTGAANIAGAITGGSVNMSGNGTFRTRHGFAIIP